MIIELLLLAIIAVLLALLNLQFYLHGLRRVEILRKVNRQRVHDSWVKEGSPKVIEALDSVGWAVRRDGKVEMGRQI